MSTLPQRNIGVYVTLGVAVVGALVAGLVLYTSSQASEVELTSAELVPGDAGIYFALNTDLSSDQWIAAFDLARRMGGPEDAEEELSESAEEEGDLDWEDDVAPFLGGNASLYLKGFELESYAVQGALILKADDAERALEVVLEEAGGIEGESYGGATIYIDDITASYFTRLDDHLVFAMDEESLREVIDVSNDDGESLADNDDFRRLRDELTGNFLSFVYLSWEQVAGDFAIQDEETRDALEEAGLGDLVFEPAAGVFGAKEDAFEFQAAAAGESGVITPMTEPRDSRFVSMVPADTAFFVSTAGVAQTWQQVTEAARDEIDEAIRAEGEYDSLDEAMRDAGSEVGLESIEELIGLFTGETAMAGWFPTGDENEEVVALLGEVSDEAAARDVVDSILETEDDVRTDSIGGVEVSVFTDDDGSDVGVLVHDGYLALGDIEALREILEPSGPVLSERDFYNNAVDLMPTDLGSYAYFNMADILRLAEGGVPPELDEAGRVIEAMILNMVETNEIVRLSGVLTVSDEE